MQLFPLITNILINEEKAEIEKDNKGHYFTIAPKNVILCFNESLELIFCKKIKNLTLQFTLILNELLM